MKVYIRGIVCICYKGEVAQIFCETCFLSQAASPSNIAAMKLSNLSQLSIALALFLPDASCSISTTNIVSICSTSCGVVSQSSVGTTTAFLTVDVITTVISTSTPSVTVQPAPQTITSTTTQFATSTKTLPNTSMNTFTSTVSNNPSHSPLLVKEMGVS